MFFMEAGLMTQTALLPMNKAKLNYKYRVFSIKNIKKAQRLLDLGLTKETKIVPVHRSPTGSLTAYKICEAVIALRDEDTKNIMAYEC